MSTATQERVRRIQKLAGEAERAGRHAITCTYAGRWARTNGSELSTLLHDLAKRIEAEEEGSL